MTHDGLGKYLSQKIDKAAGRDGRHRPDPQGHEDRRRRLLPAGRLRAGDQVVRRADPRGRLRLRQLHPGLHRPRGLLGQPLQEGQPADRRRRHQVAGRRHDHPPQSRPPVPRARRQARAHLAAQRRRQHGLLQHARARAPRVEEDLQDQRRDLDRRPRACPPDDVHVGPSDYVPWLTDRKWAHIRLEGEAFGDVPLTAELKLEVWDSPNSAGIVIDAVRCCKLALNNGVGGQLDGPQLLPDEVAAQPAARRRARATTPRRSSPSTARSSAPPRPALPPRSRPKTA